MLLESQSRALKTRIMA